MHHKIDVSMRLREENLEIFHDYQVVIEITFDCDLPRNRFYFEPKKLNIPLIKSSVFSVILHAIMVAKLYFIFENNNLTVNH